MKLTQIATLLNEKIIPNIFGGDETYGTTIAEDLRNVVDVGTKIADLAADDLKDFAGQFAVGVIDDFLTNRKYDSETYGLYIREQEYAGALMRTRAKLLSAVDTPILSLEDYNADSSAPDYLDGHYYGTGLDTKLYTKSVASMIQYSIPIEMFKKSFMSASGVERLVSLIENNADNTLTLELNALAKAVLRKLILSASTGSRKIQLITTYNTQFGLSSGDSGFITLDNWSQSTSFKLWCEELVIKLRQYITEFNIKYNDGSVEGFCPASDTRVALLTEFATSLDFAQSSVYHNELTAVGQYYKVNYWQNGSEDLIPYIASGSVHDEVVEKVADSGESQTATVSHVVGLVYDKYSAFITNALNKVTTQYVPKGDFNTFFHHMSKQYAIDTASTAIVLTLE